MKCRSPRSRPDFLSNVHARRGVSKTYTRLRPDVDPPATLTRRNGTASRPPVGGAAPPN